MIHNQPVLLESLVHLAWCDGQLRDEELQFLRDLFQELGVEHFLQERWLTEGPPLPKEGDLIVACPDPGTRREFLKLAARLAWVDGELSDPEWLVLKHFCQTLGVRKHTWIELQTWLGV
jgi:tellurite resistance protein